MFVYKIRLALEYRHGHVTGFVLRRCPFCTNVVVAGKMADTLLRFASLSQAVAVMQRDQIQALCWSLYLVHA
jgi:hypothetical protein